MDINSVLNNISFDMPKSKTNIIKVIGVGGGGGNAVNYMHKQGIEGVDYVICNTDAQALERSSILNKIQLGVSLTEGLGAGADPEVGEKAAMESVEDIKAMLGDSTKMVFITAGMGGGTGTGAAPIIAKICKEKDILTIGIVTSPFKFEGRPRFEQAQKGIEKLRQYVDSLIVINNDKLRDIYGNLGIKSGYAKADEVLTIAAKGIAEIITKPFDVNVDLRDVKKVLSDSGTAIMGSAKGKGQNRAMEAITAALDSPLLNDNKINGAKNVLLLIVYGNDEIKVEEVEEIHEYIQKEAGGSYQTDIIHGIGEDPSLDDEIIVTIVATGFNSEQQHEIIDLEQKKIVHILENEQPIIQELDTKTSFTDISFENFQNNLKNESASKNEIPEQEKIINYLEDFDDEDDDFSGWGSTPVAPPPTLEKPVIAEKTQVLEVKAPSIERTALTEKPQTDFLANIKNNPLYHLPVEFEIIPNKEVISAVPPQEFVIYSQKKEKPISVKKEIKTEIPEKKTLTLFETNLAEEKKETKTIRHFLSDVETETETISAPISEKKIISSLEEEIPFQIKVVEPEEVPNKAIDDLKASLNNRSKSFKSFNHTFNRSASSMREMEEIPAYKRNGQGLEMFDTESNVSRFSFNTDSNNALQIRKNNSFLHDNVD